MNYTFLESSLTGILNTLLYHPQLIVDGNMELVCLVMKCPKANVAFSDSELFMVKHSPYANHLASAPQRQLVSSHNAIVIYQANKY